MRAVITILLFVCLSFQCFVRLGIVVWFNCNRDYVAKNLCENRDKPQMKCCGKCYLKKQLNKVHDEQSKSGPNSLKWEKGEFPVFVIPSAISFTAPSFATTQLLFPNYVVALVTNPANTVFHPPLA